MSIFLDTADIKEVESFYNMGIIRGVTTNPTILMKDKIKNVEFTVGYIAEFIHPYPVSIEVTETDYKKVMQQAKEFSSWNNNIIIKVTVHGPNGELENLQIIHELEKSGIKVNVTAMMSAQQCLLASLAGAHYLSIFGGRVNNMGYNVCDEIIKLRKILDKTHSLSKIIVGSVREVINVIDWLDAGAHIVTVTPQILKGMIVHPYTKETVQMFLEDAHKCQT